MSQTIRCECR